MPVSLIVAVTDDEWFEFLRRRPDLDEVNFWSPSPKPFRALTPGELFLFKLHAPRNVIVGGGIFAHATVLPCSRAWETFGEANGAADLLEMRNRIRRYHRIDRGDKTDFEIGCRILTQPFFLDEPEWLAVPDWHPNIVAFKTYDTGQEHGLDLWERFNEQTQSRHRHTMAEGVARFGTPHLIAPRLGQGAFRALVTDTYRRRCAVTQERVLPALEAAHIRPYSDGGPHTASNGILLRRDIHSLFDAGYVTVTPSLRFEVSPRIREEFDNGRIYYALHGQSIETPRSPSALPDVAALSWHNENIFKG